MGVGFISFLESIILPIPLEAMLIPLLQSRRDRLWEICLSALLGCLLGASLGYFFGYYLFEQIGDQLISWLASPSEFNTIRADIHEQGFWFVLSVGITPVPFQIAMLAAGATGYAFSLYILATSFARAARYFGLGLLVWLLGNQAQQWFQQYKTQTATISFLLVALVWVGASYFY